MSFGCVWVWVEMIVVVEEADEVELWLDIMQVFNAGDPKTVKTLRADASEIRAIMSASRRTVLSRMREKRKKREAQRESRNTKS
jgi:hypothetical protein